MKRFLLFFSVLSFLSAISCQQKSAPVDFVDPFIGTGGHGHTFPGATLPFAMVQLSPDTRLTGWDGCSGYHYSDSIIYGFSHTHLSGTGIADYCDILLMPTSGKYYLHNGYPNRINRGYASHFDKQNEKASPGFYSVYLKDYDIRVALTVSKRVGFHKYTFPKNKRAFVILDLTHRDPVITSSFKQISPYEIQGMRRSRSWAKNQTVYFYARFNHPVRHLHLAVNDTIRRGQTAAQGKNIKAVFDFGKLTSPLLIKVGLSPVSCKGAQYNTQQEIPGWNFDSVRTRAREVWNRELSKIKIKADKQTKTIFYTALYHTMIAPNLFMDADSQYLGTDFKIHKAKRFTNYTIFSLWDTFRAAHPLYTLIEPQRDLDFIRTFIHQYKNGGQLPVWELAANYTGCMIGYHAVSVIADAYVKGLRNFDVQTAFEAMKHSAMQDHLGLKYYKKYGYIPGNKESASVSKTLEYAYDDWCIAQMAKALHRHDDYVYFLHRAQSYKNLFDPQTGFMRPKFYGAWKYPFDPREVDFNYTEANAWQYTFFVPQDISGLMALMGGKKKFARKLDALFHAPSQTTGRKQADITGLIGQYAHGNEPSHHIAYLYDYAGQPWKTQAAVRKILHEMYSDRPDGLAGNEDCGQMSAWYVLSAMGFYSVTPGSDLYAIGSPNVQEARIALQNGRTFVIRAENLSPRNKYIRSALLNGKPYNKAFLSQQTILRGGRLVFKMGASPDTTWGTPPNAQPVSAITEYPVLPVPYCTIKNHVFHGRISVPLFDLDPRARIYYAPAAQHQFRLYRKPFTVNQSTTIRFFAQHDSLQSPTDRLELVRFVSRFAIHLKVRPSSQYTAGSDSALIDGIIGSNDFRDGCWQGYEGNDFDAVIDLRKTRTISRISAHFLQDINSWIFMPLYVEFYASRDGRHFTRLGRVNNSVHPQQAGAVSKYFTLKVKPQAMRYVRVFAKNRGVCPPWHKGHGGKAWIFVDEIGAK